jgi:hypothetical protein
MSAQGIAPNTDSRSSFITFVCEYRHTTTLIFDNIALAAMLYNPHMGKSCSAMCNLYSVRKSRQPIREPHFALRLQASRG